MTKADIMIVDDEFGVRDSLSRWLADDNYRVGTAESATEALKKLDKELANKLLGLINK